MTIQTTFGRLCLAVAATLTACGGGSKTAAPPATPAPEPAPAPAPVAETPPAPAPVAAPQPPSQQEAEHLVIMRLHECHAALIAKDLEKAAACYTDDATASMADTGETFTGGKDIVEKMFGPLQAAYPDFKPSPTLVLVNGQRVAAIALVNGTNDGPFAGMPATHKRIGLHGLRVVEMSGDKIKSDRHAVDLGTWMAQLGLVPGPHRPVIDAATLTEKPEVVLATDSKQESENVALVGKICEAFNKHDAKAVLELSTDDTVWSDQTMPADDVGKKAVEGTLKMVFKAFPDITGKCESWGAGDYVVNLVDWTGTNKGAIPGFIKKPTKKQVHIHDFEIYKVAGGKVSKYWRFSNGMAMAAQLGMLPKAPKAPKAAKPKAK